MLTAGAFTRPLNLRAEASGLKGFYVPSRAEKLKIIELLGISQPWFTRGRRAQTAARRTRAPAAANRVFTAILPGLERPG
jgi:hypothetical protein